MKHHSQIILLALFMTGMVSAQNNDSIREKIRSQEDTELLLLSKGRNLIIDQLDRGDLGGLADMKNFLVKEMGDPYNAFTVAEYWLLSFWTEEYRAILTDAELLAKEASINRWGNYFNTDRFLPSRLLVSIAETDKLHERAGIKTAESFIPLTVLIDEAGLEVEEKEFLKTLLFSLLVSPEEEDDPLTGEMNNRANAFLESYPGSRFDEYTRKFIRYEYLLSNWGVGYKFQIGAHFLTGELSHRFREGVAFGFSFEVLYKQLHLLLQANFVPSKTKEDIPFGQAVWPGNTSATIAAGDVALGYPVFMNRSVKVMPFAGVGGMAISPADKVKKEYPDMEHFTNPGAFNLLAGVEMRLNFWNKKMDLSGKGGDYLGLRYTFYLPGYKKKQDFLAGNMHQITISYGLSGRPVKRRY